MGECYKYEDMSKGICYKAANRPNKFQTHGALVGGPKTPTDAGSAWRKPYSEDGWNDWRTDWIGSEQALDYNAGFTMALAASLDLPRSFWASYCGGGRCALARAVAPCVCRRQRHACTAA
jgi:Glycosyl hydrolase family 9